MYPYFWFLDDGNKHLSRQWDLIVTGPNLEDDGCRIKIQVVSEVTGKTRLAHKRQKRPNRAIGEDEEILERLSTMHANLEFQTSFEVSFWNDNYWEIYKPKNWNRFDNDEPYLYFDS